MSSFDFIGLAAWKFHVFLSSQKFFFNKFKFPEGEFWELRCLILINTYHLWQWSPQKGAMP